MTFRERLTADVGDPDPLWLYYLRKNTDGAGIAWAILTLGLGVSSRSLVWVALIACVLYVVVGQVRWWTTHPLQLWGRGGLLDDLLFHFWTGAIPLVLAVGVARWGRSGALVFLVVWLIVWWQLDAAGFGPQRSGAAP